MLGNMLFICSSARAFEDKIDNHPSPSRRLRSSRLPTLESPKHRKVSKAVIGTPTDFVHFQHIKSGSNYNDTDLNAVSTLEWRTLVKRNLADPSPLSVGSGIRQLDLGLNMRVPPQPSVSSPISPCSDSPLLPPTPTPVASAPSEAYARRRSTLVLRKPVPAFIDESIVPISPSIATSPEITERAQNDLPSSQSQ